MIDLKQLLQDILTASIDDLQRILSKVKVEIAKRTRDLPGYIEYIPDFCTDEATLDAVWKDCGTLGLIDSSRKAQPQWLSPVNKPYIYPDSNPIHKAKDISQFPAITGIMEKINQIPGIQGPVNSCFVLKYTSDSNALSPHADDEDILDHSKAICNFSIGASRTLEFFDKSKGKPITNVRMDNNSLTIMKAGTQDLMKHCVRAEKKRSNNNASQLRYSLSFRALAKSNGINKVNVGETGLNNSITEQEKVGPAKKHICLLAGDSFAARLDEHLLGRNTLEVRNIAQGGAKIGQVMEQLENFCCGHREIVVDKLIVSVGTNDIRNCVNGIDHLRGPFKQLCSRIKDLFPTTRVYFQSLLPLPLYHQHDWNTNRNVLALNRVIYFECIYRNFYYIDAFVPFSMHWRPYSGPRIRKDYLFEAGGIHPITNGGMGVLAGLYRRALHSKYFNPRVFQ